MKLPVEEDGAREAAEGASDHADALGLGIGVRPQQARAGAHAGAEKTAHRGDENIGPARVCHVREPGARDCSQGKPEPGGSGGVARIFPVALSQAGSELAEQDALGRAKGSAAEVRGLQARVVREQRARGEARDRAAEHTDEFAVALCFGCQHAHAQPGAHAECSGRRGGRIVGRVGIVFGRGQRADDARCWRKGQQAAS